jgi:hypothetical protein
MWFTTQVILGSGGAALMRRIQIKDAAIMLARAGIMLAPASIRFDRMYSL